MSEVVAIQVCVDVNGNVGTEYLDTAIFNRDTTLEEVLTWARMRPGNSGRLMLTVPTTPAQPAGGG